MSYATEGEIESAFNRCYRRDMKKAKCSSSSVQKYLLQRWTCFKFSNESVHDSIRSNLLNNFISSILSYNAFYQ